MRRISYFARKEKDGRFTPVKRVEWPDQNQAIHKPIEERIHFAQSTEAEALAICANDAAWQEIVAADAGAKTEIIHPERRQA